MRHVKVVTVKRADAYTDFLNALWRAWQDFRYQKNEEIAF